jgi:hypothetical protein
MKNHPLLAFVLGCWLGGSILMMAVVSYNFAGFEDLFARNPQLAEHAGFDPRDTDAKKASLLWVHAAELNRVFFQGWNRAQFVLGGLALVLAVAARAPRLPLILLALGLALVLLTHLALEPRIVELGRQLDFRPRTPPPPMLAAFQAAHRDYFIADTARFVLVLAAGGLLLLRGSRPSRRPSLPDVQAVGDPKAP